MSLPEILTDERTAFFRESLHAREPVQLAIYEQGAAEPTYCELGQSFALMGRSNRCQVSLKHQDVSFRHAYLQEFGGRVLCVDLNSRSGTLWGKNRCRACWLTEINGPQIGPYQIRVASTPLPEETPFPADFAPLDAIEENLYGCPRVRLEFIGGKGTKGTWTINRMLTLLGSGPGCKIHLDDSSISKMHCGLLMTPRGLWVIDFLGRGGTSVNGRAIDYQCLNDGELLCVGPFKMRVRYEDQRRETEYREPKSSTDIAMDETSLREFDVQDGKEAAEPTLSAAQFMQTLIDTRLLTREQIEIVADGEIAEQDEYRPLAEQLVKKKVLTAWQLQQILDHKIDRLIVDDRYRLLEMLGHGSMGDVYRAYDPQRACDVAIKCPQARAVEKPRLLIRFRREAMINERIQHPNIVRALDVSDTGDYFVMEYVPGLNLKQFMQQAGPQPHGRAVSIAIQIGEALQFAYRNGVIHRDVKPSNILLTEDGTAKLLDLGLARLDDDPDSETEWSEEETAQMTQAGVKLGTTRYMAPEQALDGHSADVRSDIYGLVCTLYHLLAGIPPFDDDNPVKILMMHAQDPVPPIEGVDDRLMSIIEKGMAKKPADRFQTPADLVDRLRDWQTIRAQQKQIARLQVELQNLRSQLGEDEES